MQVQLQRTVFHRWLQPIENTGFHKWQSGRFRWPCDNLPHLEERANRAVERRSSFEGIPNGFARMSFLDGVGSSHTKATATEIQNLRRICCAHGPASFGQVNSSLNVDPLEDWSETELPSCV